MRIYLILAYKCKHVLFHKLKTIYTFACLFQTNLFLAMVEEEERAEESRREMAETLLSALTDRRQQRQTWRDR